MIPKPGFGIMFREREREREGVSLWNIFSSLLLLRWVMTPELGFGIMFREREREGKSLEYLFFF
jgi:hypothetical protein